MTTASTEGIKKRKQPPKFQHLHPDRAKLLKKAWIDKAKLKSKWRAEKRRDGLLERSKLGIAELEDNEASDEEDDEEDKSHSERAQSVEQSPPPQAAPTIITPPQVKNVKRDNKDSRAQKRKRGQPEEPSEPQTLRDLTREAYSRSSLHTFKSHPLKKGKTAAGQGRQHGEKGRGQPNMKLRMNAMLAKIKQDLS